MRTPEESWIDGLTLPVLLEQARKTYGTAIRTGFTDAGFDDMPRLGARVVGGIKRHGALQGDFARQLGVSKQAASQLIDTLELRGYVKRVPDPSDRRRVSVELTSRGVEAAEVSRKAVDEIDRALRDAVGEKSIVAMRKVLAAIVMMRDDED
jgi:DNA-binding MarR family transcriptional regulator